MNLSPNFTLAELTVTGSGLPNVPDEQHIAALTALCQNVLEPLRAHFSAPVIVSSGFRSPAVNSRAGGAADSQHLAGEAADIHIPGVDNADIWRWIDEGDIEFDQLIGERLEEEHPSAGWVHVSYRVDRARKDAISSPTAGHYVEGLHFA